MCWFIISDKDNIRAYPQQTCNTMRYENCHSNIKPDTQCTHNVNIEASVQPLLQGKSYKYYIFWVALLVAFVIQNITRKRHVVICGVSRSIEFFPVTS